MRCLRHVTPMIVIPFSAIVVACREPPAPEPPPEPPDHAALMIEWGVSVMESWTDPSMQSVPPEREPIDEARARYWSIAEAAYSVAFDPSEQPLWDDEDGRIKTMALMLSIANSESRFRRSVDMGTGHESRGRDGKDWCLMQIRMGGSKSGKSARRVVLTADGIRFTADGTGFGGEDLISDRSLCFRVGVRMMRDSFRRCASLPVEERLSAYISGSCKKSRSASRHRVGKVARVVAACPHSRVHAGLVARGSSTPGKVPN